MLVVPPFRIAHPGCPRRSYRLPHELRVDLSALAPDLYCVLAVQNFWAEDRDPDLNQALAGVFLARRRADGAWEQPENWPAECRSLATLGHLDTRRPGAAALLPRDHQY